MTTIALSHHIAMRRWHRSRREYILLAIAVNIRRQVHVHGVWRKTNYSFSILWAQDSAPVIAFLRVAQLRYFAMIAKARHPTDGSLVVMARGEQMGVTLCAQQAFADFKIVKLVSLVAERAMPARARPQVRLVAARCTRAAPPIEVWHGSMHFVLGSVLLASIEAACC